MKRVLLTAAVVATTFGVCANSAGASTVPRPNTKHLYSAGVPSAVHALTPGAVPRAAHSASARAAAKNTVRRSDGRVVALLPRRAYSYNHRNVTVAPRISAVSGRHVVVTSKAVDVFTSSGRHIARSMRLGLPVGKYEIRPHVAYRTYGFVTKHRTIKTWHPGGEPSDSQCTVTAVSGDDGQGDGGGTGIASADCVNPAYPNQTVTVGPDLVTNQTYAAYYVDQVVASDYVDFKGFYTTRQKAYRVKVWTGRHLFASGAVRLQIIQGGHLQFWVGDSSGHTPYFSTPHAWQVVYAFDCTDFGMAGNFILTLHRKGDPSYQDKVLRNVIRRGGSGGIRIPTAGTYQLQVITECSIAVGDHWNYS